MCDSQSAVPEVGPPFRKERGQAREFPGDLSERATPVPIPNTEVKPLSDGSSWSEGACEISASPGYKSKARAPDP